MYRQLSMLTNMWSTQNVLPEHLITSETFTQQKTLSLTSRNLDWLFLWTHKLLQIVLIINLFIPSFLSSFICSSLFLFSRNASINYLIASIIHPNIHSLYTASWNETQLFNWTDLFPRLRHWLDERMDQIINSASGSWNFLGKF